MDRNTPIGKQREPSSKMAESHRSAGASRMDPDEWKFNKYFDQAVEDFNEGGQGTFEKDFEGAHDAAGLSLKQITDKYRNKKHHRQIKGALTNAMSMDNPDAAKLPPMPEAEDVWAANLGSPGAATNEDNQEGFGEVDENANAAYDNPGVKIVIQDSLP